MQESARGRYRRKKGHGSAAFLSSPRQPLLSRLWRTVKGCTFKHVLDAYGWHLEVPNHRSGDKPQSANIYKRGCTHLSIVTVGSVTNVKAMWLHTCHHGSPRQGIDHCAKTGHTTPASQAKQSLRFACEPAARQAPEEHRPLMSACRHVRGHASA